MPYRVADLVAEPQAARWARDCAWVPGTGHCRNRPCSTQCLFRAQREAEAARVVEARRARRPIERALGRAARVVSVVLFR